MPFKNQWSDYASRGLWGPRATTHKYVENSDQAAECLASSSSRPAYMHSKLNTTECSSSGFGTWENDILFFFGNQANNGIICSFGPIIRLTLTPIIWRTPISDKGAQWLSGGVLDSTGPKRHGFEPHRCLCVVSLSKNINPSLVLVEPRKTRHYITERLLIWRKESNQTHTKNCDNTICSSSRT